MTEHRPIVATNQTRRIAENRGRMGWRGRLLTANRYVLGCALVLALLVPEFFHPASSGLGPWFAYKFSTWAIEPSILCAGVAIVAGHFVLQNTGILPLITARSLILPTFLSTFGTTLLVLYAWKFPVARYHMWSAFIVAIAWYYLLAMLRTRHLHPVVGTIGIPHHFLETLPESIDWLELKQPRLPRRVAAVVVDPDASLDLGWSKFITKLVLDGTPVYHRSHFEEGLTGKVYFASHADNNFGALLPSLAYLRVKRAGDVVAALCALPVVIPVLLVACLAIRFEGPGSPVFRQERIGFRDKRFVCYKLRTMRRDLEGPDFTVENDPRVTRLGARLRKWRIDELPQLFNILKGDMSWIGPRPEAVSLARRYSRHVPFYDYRHAVRPGISGWAAIHQGNVGDVDAASEKLAYDFYYIKYFSVWLDFLIAVKTVQIVWTGSGSR